MLNRYLGNKKELLSPIMNVISEITPEGGVVGDLFAGSMAVTRSLKLSGYSVIANDINDFSSAYGHAFIVNNKIPNIPQELIPSSSRSEVKNKAKSIIEQMHGKEGFNFLNDAEKKKLYLPLIELIEYINSASEEDVPKNYRATHFFDTYTEEGVNSEFKSLRGTSGRRRFFSGSNGKKLDVILNLIRWWNREFEVSKELTALCTAITCRAAEKVGNNQGTWHDFPRDWIDSRALQPLNLSAPPFDVVFAGGDHMVGDAEDSLEFARRMPRVDTLYLDPPYNFRQYTSYYFLPNVITRYPTMDNPEEWFSKVKFVRGQNMEDDFDSSFCKKKLFIPSLQSLIGRVNTNFVVLSYFSGKNHWSDFKGEVNDVGLNLLSDFFKSDMFEDQSFRVIPIPRSNYQSYAGHNSRTIDEYIFVARKKNELA